jgi:hypothetical protein
MISTSFYVKLCSYNSSENISDYTFFDLVKYVLISKRDFLIFFSSFIPLSILSLSFFFLFIWNIYIFKLLMQPIQNIYQKFRAVRLNILRVKLLQVFIKNHRCIKWFSCIYFIINVSLLQFKLNIGIKILAKLRVLDKKLFLLKPMILGSLILNRLKWSNMFGNCRNHIEESRTRNERLKAYIHVTVDLIAVY